MGAIMALHPGDKNFDDYPTGDAAVQSARADALKVAQSIEEQGGPPAEQLADKQVVAVIAYLQRLGTDLTAAPEADDAEAAPEEDAPAEAAAQAVPTTLGSTTTNGGR